MALHGDVSVNRVVIGTWTARRLESLRDNGAHRYVCTYERKERHNDGQAVCTFEIVHLYRDGPEVLVTKVLTEALRVMHGDA